MISKKKFYIYILFIFIFIDVSAQKQTGTSSKNITVVAGKQYDKSPFCEWFWGTNRRKEWTTPINVPIVLLDTLYGGLKPIKAGGGNETKSLRLQSSAGKEYTLRSIDKDRYHLVPKLLRKTTFANIVQDGVSMNHPYAAFALGVMMDSARIFHARPILVYVPRQATLDTFNSAFANDLYMLEERIDGDWSNAEHLGGYKNYYSTNKVKEVLRDSNKHKVDQNAFIKARLFDILISDIDRHQDNWRWGVADTGVIKYMPLPRDRDQAFFTRNGLLTNLSTAIIRRRFLQSFNYKIRNVSKLTSYDGMLDKFFANEMDRDDWLDAAAILQQKLTDSVIDRSVKQLPPEIFSVSGDEIIDKLKARTSKLKLYADLYYNTLAKKVEVNGTIENEFFEVKDLSKNELEVNVYRIDSKGQRETKPYYNRIFKARETKRVILYGFGGEDVFDVKNRSRHIKVSIRKGINDKQFDQKGKDDDE